jgi:hypothetical protein
LITSWADKKHQIVVEKSLHPSPGCPKTTQIKKRGRLLTLFIMLPQNAAIALADLIRAR